MASKEQWFDGVVRKRGDFPFFVEENEIYSLKEMEIIHAARVLHYTEGNISMAARLLQIDRRSLQRKIPRMKREARKFR